MTSTVVPGHPTVVRTHEPDVWSYRALLWRLAVRHVRSRYSHSVLGIYWALINPLVTAAVLGLVFGPMLRVIVHQETPFVLFVLSGLLLWSFFNNSVADASLSITNYATLLGKVRFPRSVLPLAAVAARCIDLLFSAGVLIVLMAIWRVPVTPAMVWSIPILGIVIVITIGVSLAVASLNVVYRDVHHIVSLILLLWFYLCPIVYSFDQVSEPFRTLLLINPLASLISEFRGVFLFGVAPSTPYLLSAAAVSSLILMLGWAIFRRLDATFAEIL
jgi:ABC-type polysaccharide/polyol phosphate export permease